MINYEFIPTAQACIIYQQSKIENKTANPIKNPCTWIVINIFIISAK